MVTAMFADIKGSTELMENLDPEEARAIIDPALKLMIDAARRYDGYIVQSTGDGIFALFGAPVAHEDHPQRSLYAALRMQEEIRRYAERLRGDGRAPIQIRVGVNTGEVVVRSIATGAGHVEYTPIGHTTNLASRMQTLADPGATPPRPNPRKARAGWSKATSFSSRWGRRGSKASPIRSNCTKLQDSARCERGCNARPDAGLPSSSGANARWMRCATRPGARSRDTDRSSQRWRRRASASRACCSSSRPPPRPAGWCSRLSQSHTARRRPTCR